MCKAFSLILIIGFAGCATIVSKSRYSFSVKANEPDTIVKVYDKKNVFLTSIKTPGTIELDADAGMFSSASYRFVFEKPGFENDESIINAKIDPCYWINFICLYSAPLGMLLVDPISGAMWAFDENITIMGFLRSKGELPDRKLPQVAQTYHIVSCERESGNDFSYRFVLKLNNKDDNSLAVFSFIQKEFRDAIKRDYAESFPGVKLDSLFVDFPEYKLNNDKIEGRAVVLLISIIAITYDPNTRTGKLAVKVNANQYEEARKWIRKNIEALARDKNIALTTGEIPPAAKFYLGREELKDGNVLEIEFKTE